MNRTTSRGARLSAPPRRRGYPGLLAALLLAVAVPLSMIASGPGVLPGDVAVTMMIQDATPQSIDGLIRALNIIGRSAVLGVMAAIIMLGLVIRQAYAAALAVAVTLVGYGLNALLKLLLGSPRPTSDLVQITDPGNGFGFPSGHTMGTTLFCGVLLYLITVSMPRTLTRTVLQVFLVAMPVAMGVARIEVGAHWPSDVLGAYLWGIIATLGIAVLYERLFPRAVAWTASINRPIRRDSAPQLAALERRPGLAVRSDVRELRRQSAGRKD